MTLDDHSTHSGRAEALEQLRAQLPAMGPLGRVAARFIDQAEAARKSRSR